MYKFVIIPFGLSTAPRIFTKLLKLPVSKLRTWGVIMNMYLDDSWQFGHMFAEAQQVTTLVYNLFVQCGFLPNIEKSVLTPTQSLDTLGFNLNSHTMIITISSDKTMDIIEHCNSFLVNHVCSICVLATFIGKCIAVFPAFPLGQLHYHTLERCKIYYLQKSGWNYDASAILDFKCICEIKWWKHNISRAWAPIRRKNPEIVMTADACKHSWGACIEGVCTNGHFSKNEMCLSMNTKET